jgi:DNA-directed RNA polymerase subunit L
LTSEFSVNTSLANSAYNVVSKCSYGNTPNHTNIDRIWEEQELKLVGEQMTKQEIEIQKKNFMLLDAQRHFIPDSFDFTVQSIGIYDNKELVKKACEVLNKKFVLMVEGIDSDIIPINNSETTMEFCFDVILENEDYTVGKALEYILYEKFYQGEKILSFCGFKKFHPHNTESVVRIAFNENSDKNTVRQILRKACVEAADVFKKVYLMF